MSGPVTFDDDADPDPMVIPVIEEEATIGKRMVEREHARPRAAGLEKWRRIMAKTLVGAFDDTDSAQNAVRDLQAAGVRSNHIRMMSGAEAYAGAESSDDGRSWADKVGDWFGSLFDDADDKLHADDYAEAYRRGQVLVIADVDDVMVESAIAILNRYGTIDLSSRAKKWKEGGYRGFDRTTRPYGADERAQELAGYRGQVLPVVQEEMAVGKRVIQRGGVRVHSYVQERPVEEIVRLREERIEAQRRSVKGVKGKVPRTDGRGDSIPISSRRVVPPESRRPN